MTGLYEQIEKFTRLSVPYALMFCFYVLNVISMAAPIIMAIDLPLVVMLIYYWSIYRPTLIPPALVFVAGICFDALIGWPIGINSFIFLVLRQSVSNQRLFLSGQPFIVIWLGFMFALSIVFLVQWCLFSLIFFHLAAIQPLLTSLIAAILIYPLINLILSISHKILPDLPDQYSAVG